LQGTLYQEKFGNPGWLLFTVFWIADNEAKSSKKFMKKKPSQQKKQELSKIYGLIETLELV
jgi:hypothetical protein